MTGNAVLLSTFIDAVRRRNEANESQATVQEIARAVLAASTPNAEWKMLGLDVGLNGAFENEVFNALITCPRIHRIALLPDLDASTAQRNFQND